MWQLPAHVHCHLIWVSSRWWPSNFSFFKIRKSLRSSFSSQLSTWADNCHISVQLAWQCPYLSALEFCNSAAWNIQFDELDFLSSLNWSFLPAVACKIQVWNRLKIMFIKLDFSNWRILKISGGIKGICPEYVAK